MTPFHLKIVTPDGLLFDGQAEELIVRSITGDLAILAHHVNFVTPLGMGRAVVITEGRSRTAACIGGLLSVINNEVTLVPTTFEWADAIDVKRVEVSMARADQILKNKESTETDLKLAQARLRRALVRHSVAFNK